MEDSSSSTISQPTTTAKQTPSDDDNSTTTSSSNRSRILHIDELNLAFLWQWDSDIDTCAICRVELVDSCFRCDAEDSNVPSTCIVVWGKCGHCFHNCCVSLWVQRSPKCPMCQAPWVVAKMGQ